MILIHLLCRFLGSVVLTRHSCSTNWLHMFLTWFCLELHSISMCSVAGQRMTKDGLSVCRCFSVLFKSRILDNVCDWQQDQISSIPHGGSLQNCVNGLLQLQGCYNFPYAGIGGSIISPIWKAMCVRSAQVCSRLVAKCMQGAAQSLVNQLCRLSHHCSGTVRTEFQ